MHHESLGMPLCNSSLMTFHLLRKQKYTYTSIKIMTIYTNRNSDIFLNYEYHIR